VIKKIMGKYTILPVQVKASFWFLICSFLQKGISVITTPIFTRLLSTAEYGQFNVFNSWMGILTIIVTMDLSYGVYARGLVKFEKEREIFSSSLQGLTVVFCAGWTAVYLISKDFWNKLFTLSTVQMLSMILLMWSTAVFTFWASEQRVIYKYKALVIVTLVTSLAKPIVGIVFVIQSDDKVTARILGLVLVQLLAYTWMFIVQMARGRKFYVGKYWKHALIFNIPLIPHYLSQTILNSADRIMIEKMVNDGCAGIYSLAYALSSIMIVFNTSLMDTLGPWMYTKIRDRKTKEIAPVAYGSLIIIGGVNILLIAFAPEAVAIFAPKSYYEAIWCIPPIAMSVYFMYSYDLFAKFEFYYEKTKLIAASTMVGAVLNIILNYICILLFGYIAAAYTTLVCYMLYSIFHYVAMKKVCKSEMNGEYPYETKALLTITGIFLVIGFSYLATYGNIYLRYGLTGILVIILVINKNRIKSLLNQMTGLKKNEAKDKEVHS